MLNIKTRISLSKFSKKKIKEFWRRKSGNLDSSSWGSINIDVKNEISRKLFPNQGYKCAYCERYLLGLGPEIDHFAPKAENPRFSFNPVNMYYSCHLCNSSDRKGSEDTVDVPDPRYDQCSFKIIHPYYDIPDNEIRFKDADRVDFDWTNCTDLGKETINFFQFGDVIMTTIRSRQLIFERLNPLTSQQEKELIQASIAYKRK